MSTNGTTVDPDSDRGPAACNEEGRVAPLATLMSLEQPDDAGAQTADRYEWQAAMATADALALHYQFIDGSFGSIDAFKVQIICEFHEDWVIEIGDEVELVSAKHRDTQVGPWRSPNDLVRKGGLGHLFVRWLNADRLPTTRLVTNAAVADKASGIARYRTIQRERESGRQVSEEDEKLCATALDAFCREIMKNASGIPDTWSALEHVKLQDLTVPDQLGIAGAESLRTLRIEGERPARAHTHDIGPSRYAAPLAKKLGIDNSLAKPIWESVLALIRIKMRARGESDRAGLPVVGGMNTLETPEVLLEERAVCIEDLKIVIGTCIRHPQAYTAIKVPQRFTKLSMKMTQGDCGETSIGRAEALRLDYSRYRRERRNAIPAGGGDLRRVEGILLRIADEETHAVRKPHESWGAALWKRLSDRLLAGEDDLEEYDLEHDISLGGVSQLTQDCKVWFSDGFDVGNAIVAAKARKGLRDG